MLKERDHVFLKRRTLIQPSKKLGCPSKVFVSRILKFPDYKVGELRTCLLDLHGYFKGGWKIILTNKLYISKACIVDQLSRIY
jgi:hypothetical protein